MKQLLIILLLCSIGCLSVVESDNLPKRISPVSKKAECRIGAPLTGDHNKIASILDQISLDISSDYAEPPCTCEGKWRKLVSLNMSNISQNCPSGWQHVDEESVRGCGRSSGKCSSTLFSTISPFFKVCGRIKAIQFGTPDAFHQAVTYGTGISGDYIDGISITRGSSRSRKHIWSFVAANSEKTSKTLERCACSDTRFDWSYSIPSFVGNNYFCDSGQENFSYNYTYFSDDPLWDGQGCSPTSSCCTLHNPPWFCTNIGQIVSDNIEVRICGNSPKVDEDIIVTEMELYIQ